MNWFRKLFAFTYRNYIFASRNLFAFAEILFWPVVGLVEVGIMGKFLDLQPELAIFILTGAITAGVLQVAQLDVSYSLLYDIWSKSVKHTFMAPVSEYHYVIGSWIVGIARGAVVILILAGFSGWVFGFSLPSLIVSVIFAAGLFISALVIGMLVCWLVMLYGHRVEVTAWSLSAMVMLVCGIFYPVSYLPKPIMIVAELIPLTYFLEYFRAEYGFQPLFSYLLLKGFGLSAFYVTLFFFLLRRAFLRSRRTGMILRLSE